MKLSILLCIFCFCFPVTPWLQNVAVDLEFGPDGNGYFSPNIDSDTYFETAIRPDNRIVTFGFKPAEKDSFVIVLSGFTSSGFPDPAFGQNGVVTFTTLPFLDAYVRDLIIQPSGKILGAAYISLEDSASFLIFRLLEDGSFDSTFSNDGYLEVNSIGKGFTGEALTIDDNENIYVFGFHNPLQAIYKLLPDGFPDLSFGNDGLALMPTFQNLHEPEWGRDIVRMSDGKFITTALTGEIFYEIAYITSRWNADGTPDSSFGINGSQRIIVTDDFSYFCSIHPQPDGKILYKDYNNRDNHINLARLNEDGSRDLSFGTNGRLTLDVFYGQLSNDGLLICPDGSFLMPYTLGDDQLYGYVARYLPDFTLDPTFGVNGRFQLPEKIPGQAFSSIHFQGNDKIILNVICATDDCISNTLIRLNLEGHTSASSEDISLTEIVVYPNPVSEMITLRFNLKEEKHINFDLIDAHGRTIQTLEKNLLIESGENELTFMLNNQIHPGLYYLRMISESDQEIYPLMIGQN